MTIQADDGQWCYDETTQNTLETVVMRAWLSPIRWRAHSVPQTPMTGLKRGPWRGRGRGKGNRYGMAQKEKEIERKVKGESGRDKE